METSKDMLDSNKCYVLDCGNELYVWAGRNTSLDARKAAISTVEASFVWPLATDDFEHEFACFSISSSCAY